MPKLTLEGGPSIDITDGKRLVLALVDEAKIDQLHACGGQARCTTCRVQFVSGEPDTMVEKALSTLKVRDLLMVTLTRSALKIGWPF